MVVLNPSKSDSADKPLTSDPDSDPSTGSETPAAEAASDTDEEDDEDDKDDDKDDALPLIRKDVPLMGIDPATMALGIHTFEALPLHARILEGVAKIGWTSPTPVQKLCLPFSLRGRDVAGFAQTGT